MDKFAATDGPEVGEATQMNWDSWSYDMTRYVHRKTDAEGFEVKKNEFITEGLQPPPQAESTRALTTSYFPETALSPWSVAGTST